MRDVNLADPNVCCMFSEPTQEKVEAPEHKKNYIGKDLSSTFNKLC